MKNTKNKKILLINPYLDTLGGGEKHTLAILLSAKRLGWSPYIAWENEDIINNIRMRFDIDFASDCIVSYYSKNILSRLLMTKNYDAIIYVHDGSYFFSLGKRNFIYSMYPKKELYKKTLINSIKWLNWNFISISQYTKSYIDKWTNKDSFLLFPPINTNTNISGPKEKIILSIGRFFKHLHAKRQDKLIMIFDKLKKLKKSFHDYKLILVGGMLKEDESYVKELKVMSRKVGNVEIKTNITSEELNYLLIKAKYYWHGTGLDSDKNDPSSVEHFGMAPFEAMLSGCITFCVNSGEPSRVITNGKNGFLYEDENELIQKTIYAEEHTRELIKIKKKAKIDIEKKFGLNVFNIRVKELLE